MKFQIFVLLNEDVSEVKKSISTLLQNRFQDAIFTQESE